MFISGSVFQTFLAESGIAEERIAGIVSFMTVVQLVIMLFASGKIGRVKYIVSFTVWIQTAHIPMLLFFMFGCLSGNLSSRYDYYILIAAVFVSELGFGLYNILIYKFPYHIIDMDKYGNLMAVSGVIGGIVTLLLSVILSYFQEKFSYFSVMFGMFVFVLLTIGVYAYVTGSVKKIKVKEERKREKSRKILLWKYPPFYKLLLPNLGRGFCSGAVTMMVTVGYYFNILNAKTAGILVIISSAMTFLSCIVYPTLANKYKEKI